MYYNPIQQHFENKNMTMTVTDKDHLHHLSTLVTRQIIEVLVSKIIVMPNIISSNWALLG